MSFAVRYLRRLFPIEDDHPWADLRCRESLAGESRANLLRLAAILMFYGHHLANVFLFADDPTVRGAYHAAVTSLVVAWSLVTLAVYLCVARQWVGAGLKYAVTAADIVLVTLTLCFTRDPKSMLAALYFLVIASAALRLSLPLVWWATLGSAAGYLAFLGYWRFWLQLPLEERLSRRNQVILVLALGFAGLLAGQMLRQARRLVREYPAAVSPSVEK